MNDASELTGQVKALALEAGFAAVGVAVADAVRGEQAFRAWLAAGRHAEMSYLARNVSKRFHPAELVPGAQSVLCLAVGYAPPVDGGNDSLVARYARGRDYHRVLKARCHALMDRLRQLRPDFEGRAFVDSAPLAERSLAAAAGLGWIGRNGCLIVPGWGSYVLLCEIVSNLPLVPDSPIAGDCGDCNACVTACPGGACLGDGTIDARRCLSYLSIEHRGDVPAEIRAVWGRRVFGCDACQQACPHNHDLPAGDAEITGASGGLRGPAACTLEEILAWSPDDWDRATRGSATRRATYDGLMRNAALAAASGGD